MKPYSLKKAAALYKAGKLGKILPGTLPFDPKKPTIMITKKEPGINPPPPIYRGDDGIYYKTPIAKSAPKRPNNITASFALKKGKNSSIA